MDGIEDMSNRDVIAQPIVDLLGEHELDVTPNTAPRPACSPIFSQYQFTPEESLPPQVLHQIPPEAAAEVHNSVPHQQGAPQGEASPSPKSLPPAHPARIARTASDASANDQRQPARIESVINS